MVNCAPDLNRINVFPVADGDTGTNLAITARCIDAAIAAADSDHCGKLLALVADAALDGARGNSGAIFAQFLHGLADACGGFAILRPKSFIAALRAAAQYATTAVTEPRAGTILTLIDSLADSAAAAVAANPRIDFPTLLGNCLAPLERALAETEHQLAELERAHVVDAGAAGFVAWVRGMEMQMRTGVALVPPDDAWSPAELPAIAAGAGNYRYCTELVLAGAQIDQRALRERCAALGDSLVVAGSARRLRLHIHTNDPQAVFALAAQLGTVTQQKADDMLRQAASTAARSRIAIVTDSAADLDDDTLDAHVIHVIPLRVQFAGRSYLDGVSLGSSELFRLLVANRDRVQTSQPPQGDYRRMYEFLRTHHDEVLSLTVTARVSGTHDAAAAAARRCACDGINVQDTRNASLGQGLIARYAAECAARGATMPQLLAQLQHIIARTWTFALPATLEYAVRGGRISPVAQTIADLLRCSPVLRTRSNGKVGVGGLLWGRGRSVQAFARLVVRQCRKGQRYRAAVGHGDAAERAAELRAALLAMRPDLDCAPIVPVGAALGVHGGPGLLVVAIQELPRSAPG
ncbi:MAG: DegV family protein [Steroidobacteraceae bacterium]